MIVLFTPQAGRRSPLWALGVVRAVAEVVAE
jgi:hypothetical protein